MVCNPKKSIRYDASVDSEAPNQLLTLNVNEPLEGIHPVFVDRGLQGADEASRPEGGGAVRC